MKLIAKILMLSFLAMGVAYAAVDINAATQQRSPSWKV